MPAPHTLADIAKALNRPVVVVSGLQNRFELPPADGTGYSDAYLSLLRALLYLRTLGITEERLLRLWHLEKKLLQLVHVDSAGSKTWFLDSCGAITRRDRRRVRRFKNSARIYLWSRERCITMAMGAGKSADMPPTEVAMAMTQRAGSH
jgi:hypothetical protein